MDKENVLGHRGRWGARVGFVDRLRHWLSAGLLVALAGCGGGGGGATPAAVAEPPRPEVTVSAERMSVSTGGAGVTLHATVRNSTETPLWELQGPGSLSTGQGASVIYLPPDPEEHNVAAEVTVTASLPFTGGGLGRVTLSLSPVEVQGLTWTRARPPAGRWRDVAWANGAFVAVGSYTDAQLSETVGPSEGLVMYSRDGLAWSPQRLPAGTKPLAGVAWGAQGWLAVGDYGAHWTSVDGQSWSELPRAPITGNVQQVFHANGMYVVVAADGTHVSPDGRVWSRTLSGGGGAIAYGNGVFVASSDSFLDRRTWVSTDALAWTLIPTAPAGIRSMAFGNGRFVASWGGSTQFISVDGQNWRQVNVGADVAGPINFAGGLFFASGQQSMSYSSDGEQWLTRVAPDLHHLFAKVAASPDRYVRVSRLGAIGSSANGSDWVDTVEGSPGHLQSITVADGQFVAVSSRGWALVSADGLAWERRHLTIGPMTRFLDARAVAHGGGVVAACGQGVDLRVNPEWEERGAAAFTSSNDGGRTWTPALSGEVIGICASLVHDGRRFLAVTTAGEVHESLDGSSWSLLARLNGDPKVQAVAFGGGRYMVVGDRGFVATSTDGQTWTEQGAVGVPLNAVGYNLRAVIHAAGRFIAVGPFALESPDGISWTPLYMPAGAGGLLALAHGQDRYVFSSESGQVVTGSGGPKWHLRDSGVTGRLLAVAFGNGRFVAVGHNGVATVSSR